MNFTATPEGWWVARVDAETLDRFQKRHWVDNPGRRRFDDPNSWHGFMAEAVLEEYLIACGVPYEHDGELNSRPDFVIADRTYDMKSNRYSSRPTPRHYVAVDATARGRPADNYLCAIHTPPDWLTLLGEIEKERFYELAIFRDAGQPMMPTGRPAHFPLHQIPVTELTPLSFQAGPLPGEQTALL